MARKIIFWVHLGCGIIAGLVIGVMSLTGAALAFEKEIIAWAERDAREIARPSGDATPLPLDELVRRVRAARPDAKFNNLVVSRQPTAAIVLTAGGRPGGGGANAGPTLYVNPYTAEVREAHAEGTRNFLRTMNAWHRWLGVEGEHRNAARAVTGACNAAFLGLAMTGLYLWWPRSWNRNAVRAVSLLNVRLRGKARDFNWHNAIGLWSAPVLIVLTATALPMSYRWANDALYRLTGSEPPSPGGPGERPAARSIAAITPSKHGERLDTQALVARVQAANPRWQQLTIRLSGPTERGAGPRNQADGMRTSGDAAGPRENARTVGESSPRPRPERAGDASPAPVVITLKESGTWPRTATTTLSVDPFTGSEIGRDGFAQQTAGRRLRTWTRFLHTGEAVGWPGQLIAGLVSLGGVVLMYTGFALAWRRFFGRRSPA